MDYNGNRTCIQRGNYHRMAANCSCENRTFPVEVNIPSRPVGISYVTVQTFGDIYPPQKLEQSLPPSIIPSHPPAAFLSA